MLHWSHLCVQALIPAVAIATTGAILLLYVLFNFYYVLLPVLKQHYKKLLLK